MTNTHTSADIHQGKVFEAHIVACLTAAVTGQIDVTTYAKSVTPNPTLCAIQEELGA